MRISFIITHIVCPWSIVFTVYLLSKDCQYITHIVCPWSIQLTFGDGDKVLGIGLEFIGRG